MVDFVTALEAATRFEQSMNTLVTQAGEAPESVERLKRAIAELATPGARSSDDQPVPDVFRHPDYRPE